LKYKFKLWIWAPSIYPNKNKITQFKFCVIQTPRLNRSEPNKANMREILYRFLTHRKKTLKTFTIYKCNNAPLIMRPPFQRNYINNMNKAINLSRIVINLWLIYPNRVNKWKKSNKSLKKQKIRSNLIHIKMGY